MKESIIVTYPHFKALPKAIKQLLLTSESLFFEDLRTKTTVRTSGNLVTVKFTLPKSQSITSLSESHRWSTN